MKVLWILFACVAISSAELSRIIGGTTTSIETVSFLVGLSVSGTFKCGGVIISTTTVLTSAQCVDGVTPSTITVRAGSTYLSTMGTVHTAASVLVHPNYSKTKFDYDIAILKFTTPFTISKYVNVATLPSVGETVAVGSAAKVYGWGITTIGGTSYSGSIQVATVPIVANSVCSAALSRFNSVTDRMICAGYTTGGVDVCTGDTGGPLVYASKLIGLVSWGAGCGAVGSPAVYTKISALRNWIKTEASV